MGILGWLALNFVVGAISYIVIRSLYGLDYFNNERFDLYGRYTMEWMFNFPILWIPYLVNRHIIQAKKIEEDYQKVSKEFSEEFRERVKQNRQDLEDFDPKNLF